MRTVFVVIGLFAAILAVILAVLPLSNFAFIPAIVAAIFGLLAFLKGKAQRKPKHTVQLIFLLVIMALALATYKSVMVTTEVGDTQNLEQREDNSLEESIEELEDIDIIE
ncbi:FUSC family protein [Lacinutrix chionoecetis]